MVRKLSIEEWEKTRKDSSVEMPVRVSGESIREKARKISSWEPPNFVRGRNVDLAPETNKETMVRKVRFAALAGAFLGWFVAYFFNLGYFGTMVSFAVIGGLIAFAKGGGFLPKR